VHCRWRSIQLAPLGHMPHHLSKAGIFMHLALEGFLLCRCLLPLGYVIVLELPPQFLALVQVPVEAILAHQELGTYIGDPILPPR